MAWDRQVQLVVGNPGDPTGVDIAGLDLSFKIIRTIAGSENSAEFTIYNASEDTRVKILREQASLTFRAGYADDSIGVIFIGNIIQAASVQSGGDWITNIRAAAQLALWDDYVASLSLTYSPRTPISRVLQEICNALGIVINGLENAQDILLPNGYVFAGAPYNAIQYCQQVLHSNGAGLFWDNKELVVYKKFTASRFTSVFLDYASGLLSVKDITEPFSLDTEKDGTPKIRRKRVGFSSLLNWRIRPNGLITIDTARDSDNLVTTSQPRVKGTYLVEKVEFTGDNFGGQFVTSGEASA